MQITNAGDKSTEVSAREEGCVVSQQQPLLVCSCSRGLTRDKGEAQCSVALTLQKLGPSTDRPGCCVWKALREVKYPSGKHGYLQFSCNRTNKLTFK